jgi:hypothetical protein
MMTKFCVVSVLALAAGLAVASPTGAPLMGVRTRNFPGTSDEDTIYAVRRRLVSLANVGRDTVFSNSTTIEQSWDGATLFTK